MPFIEDLKEILGQSATDEVITSINKLIGEGFLPKGVVAEQNKKAEDAWKLKYGTLNSEHEALKVANMNTEQLAQHEKDQLEKTKNDYLIKSNRLDAEKVLVGMGLPSDQYNSILDRIVSPDKDATMGLVNEISGLLGKQSEAATQKAKEDLLNKTRVPEGGDPAAGQGQTPLPETYSF